MVKHGAGIENNIRNPQVAAKQQLAKPWSCYSSRISILIVKQWEYVLLSSGMGLKQPGLASQTGVDKRREIQRSFSLEDPKRITAETVHDSNFQPKIRAYLICFKKAVVVVIIITTVIIVKRASSDGMLLLSAHFGYKLARQEWRLGRLFYVISHRLWRVQRVSQNAICHLKSSQMEEYNRIDI